MRSLEKFLGSQFDLKPKTKVLYSEAINSFEAVTGKDFEASYLNEKEVLETLTILNQNYSPSTWNLMLSKYKRLAKWLSDPDDERIPRLWRKINSIKIDWVAKLKDNWLTQGEFRRVLDAAVNPRDKAILGVTISGALRRGELLSLKIRHCKPRIYMMNGKNVAGFEITFSGKTGTATIPVVKYASLLRVWLNHHPGKNDPESPLWVSMNHPEKALKEAGIQRMMKILGRRAKLGRNLTFHMLRHSKITWVYQNRKIRISDEMARKMFRWKQNSVMPSKYAHLTGADSNYTFLALEGVKTGSTAHEEPKDLEPIGCIGCGELNSATSLYCGRCGLVLNETEAQKMIMREQKRDEVMDVLSDPQVLKDLQSLNDPEVRKVLDELQKRKKV